MANSKTYSRSLKIYIDGKEVEGSVGAINKELRKLRGEMKNLTIGTEEYEKKAAEIRKLNGILDEHRKHLKGVGDEVENTGGMFGNMLKTVTSKFTGVGKEWLGQFDGILGGMKGSWLKFAGWLGAAVVALKGAIDAGRRDRTSTTTDKRIPEHHGQRPYPCAEPNISHSQVHGQGLQGSAWYR